MKSKYFKIHELVPEHIYKKYGERAWWFINPELIKFIDLLKEKFPNGSMTINDYFWKGARNWSGLRTPEFSGYFEISQHNLGLAIDCIFSKYEESEVTKYVIDNPLEFPMIKGIEYDINWCHFDCRNSDTIIKFKK
jgi:hypothetical protein